MRRLVLVVPALIMACTENPPPESEPAGVCRNEQLGGFAGLEATARTAADIQRRSGAREIRWVQPGMMVTMEFSPTRVTVWLAPGNRIERVSCG